MTNLSLSWIEQDRWATLLVGAGLALVQTNVKRMIAHAGVAQVRGAWVLE